MHDNEIVSYIVDFEKESIKMYTYNKKKNKEEILITRGVLTHCFENILDKNILLDIKEWPLENFFQEHQSELEEKKSYCWPIYYQNIQELKTTLLIENYKYIKIESSYGLWGWILAKEIKVLSDFHSTH